MSWLGPAIDVRPLFAGQQAAFMDLLGQLSAARARTHGPGKFDFRARVSRVRG
jgi:hypothetical protein